MTTEGYSVRFDRTQGTIDISGPDKDWIAEQLERLVPALSVGSTKSVAPHHSTEDEDVSESGGNGSGNGTQKKRRTNKGTSGRSTRNSELEALLTKEVLDELSQYRAEREGHWKKQGNQIAIIATFLADRLSWKGIDGNDLYTVCNMMGWPSPNNPRASLTNAQQRDGYFTGATAGKWPLSHKGENFARHGALQGPEPGK